MGAVAIRRSGQSSQSELSRGRFFGHPKFLSHPLIDSLSFYSNVASLIGSEIFGIRIQIAQ